MSTEEFIIIVYLIIEEIYPTIVSEPLRKRGFPPALTDIEIITIQIVGECLKMDTDKSIWMFFKNNYLSWFPHLGSYPNFCKHCANLWQVHQKITAQLTAHYGQDHIHFIDGFPIPVCRYSRAKRHKNFKEHAGFSYCAAQQEKYYGFKGHLVINLEGMITGYTFAPANVDERDVAPEITENIHGLLGADKGYLRPSLKEYYKFQYVDLQTPLRKNMPDSRSQESMRLLMRARRKIETVIGQLTDRFNIQKVRARDLWHLSHRFIRKILSHTVCVVMNKKCGYSPIQFEKLI
ncbi:MULTISPECIES: IS982-like element ISAba825 family transposase [Acinetobacter]|uniref:IS982-like element ISAba825 family transposase n=1 Tax=Acinetobacter TaxID=469 RepID=UPI000CDBC182|nr:MULTISPECIES: IS982-like element ISAba825 family transposase [Acinetobacter]AUX89037.1 IS982-like element ISAba825 family transposase [Acinetobacter sp. ACNIH1]MCU4366679.1 IS982-like element ISAba825 family transposase [Acinetobacter variabilis]MCU4376755.1 IS982-like element ISAba825 family transposase [Acinetobacter variabilis]